MNSFLLKFSLLALASLGAGFVHSWMQGPQLNTSLSDALKGRGTQVATPGDGSRTGATNPHTPEAQPNASGTKVAPLDGQATKGTALPNSGTEPTPTKAPENPAHPRAQENDISLADAFAAHAKQDGQTFFIDAREPHEFNAGHIPGAMHLSPSMVARGMPQKALDNLRDVPLVIIYCGGGDCHASEDVAIKVAQAIKSIGSFKILHAGYPAWVEAKHQVEAGPDGY